MNLSIPFYKNLHTCIIRENENFQLVMILDSSYAFENFDTESSCMFCVDFKPAHKTLKLYRFLFLTIYLVFLLTHFSCFSSQESLPIPSIGKHRRLADLKPAEIWSPNGEGFETSFVHAALKRIIADHRDDSGDDNFVKFSGPITPKSYVFSEFGELREQRRNLERLKTRGITPEADTWRLDIQKEVEDDRVILQLQYGVGHTDKGGAIASINVKKYVRWELTHLYYVLAQSFLDSLDGEIVTRNVDDSFFYSNKKSANPLLRPKKKRKLKEAVSH